MTKEEKRKIKWLISAVIKDIKNVEEDIAAGADRVFCHGAFSIFERDLCRFEKTS